MNYQDYIRPELLTLIPVLYLIGAWIKKSELDDKFIPLLLGVFGVAVSTIFLLALEPIRSFQDVLAAVGSGITQGILCAGASVYANQIYKQSKK